jgi:ketosteroid isomerase-like protein
MLGLTIFIASGPSNALPSDRTIQFEEMIWTKAIRKQTSPYDDLYELQSSKVTWDNSFGELTVEETQATSMVMVGVALFFNADYSHLNITLDAKITTSNSAAQANGVAVSIFQIAADGSWIAPGGHQITTSSTWVSTSVSFENLIVGSTYSLFFYYSDGWSADHNQKIYLRNIKIEPKSTVPPVDNRGIQFEGRTWTKAIRKQTSPYDDLYELHNSKVAWDNSSGELTVGDTQGTTAVMVGVALFIKPDYSHLNISLDAKITASDPGLLAYGVAVSIFQIAADGSWIETGGHQIAISSAWVSTSVSFDNLVVGSSYSLFFHYGDGWGADYTQKIYLKNIKIESKSNVPPVNNREIQFEGQTWTKAIRKQTSPYDDLYELQSSKVTWDNSFGELTVEETQATSMVMVGVALFVTPDHSYLNISLDAKITTSNSAAQANGVAVSIFQIAADGSWIAPGGHQITTSSEWVSTSVSFDNLVVGSSYSLFFYYSDGWSADYNQKIYLKNIKIESKLIISSPSSETSPTLIISFFTDLNLLLIVLIGMGLSTAKRKLKTLNSRSGNL